MGVKKKNGPTTHENSQPKWMPNGSITARNLRSKDLSGVIFGCTHNTIQECLDKQLFGLPASHFAYVRNIYPGMALFLFNYSNRKLYGIFEAKTSGQQRIDPYAWSLDGSEPTQYPAQVRVQYRSQCLPLTEEQFKPVIERNYYIDKHFWFELDHKQTKSLIALCSSMPVTQSSVWQPMMKTNLPMKKILPPHKSGNNGNLRPFSNFLVLASDDLSSEDGSKHHSEVVQLCEGPSSTSDVSVSNSLPVVEVTKLDDSTSEPGPLLNELGYGEDDDGPVFTKDLRFIQEQKSGSKVTDSRNDCVEWEIIPTTLSTGKKHMVETCISDQRVKEISDTKPRLEISGSSVSEMDSSKSLKAPTTSGFHTVMSERLQESTMLMKTHTQMHTVKEGAHSALSGLSTGLQHTLVGTSGKVMAEESIPFVGVNSEMHLSDQNFILLKLAQELENLKAAQILQTWKVNSLELELGESKEEVRLLRQKYEMLESISQPQPTRKCSAKSSCQPTSDAIASSSESVFLVGGCDGESWLSSLNLYTPSSDIITSLKPMEIARSYAPATKLNGNIYVLGGVDSETASCYDTVASYNLSNNQWTTCPPLKQPKGNLAATSVNGKIFAIGGGSGIDCFSEVEMFDSNVGMWFQTRSMRNKRFAPAAVEIDGVIYVVGGYNGKNYLKSAERFDHREHSWTPLESMSTSRGCHSLAVLNGKIYAMGGYDGARMVSTVEVFDPRNGKWTTGKDMNIARGYAGAAVLGESIYIMGGMKDHVEVLDTVECYQEGKGWQRTKLKGIGKRCFFSAIEM